MTATASTHVTDAETLSMETRGIEPVPENERNGNPLQLFWVWFAANISILGLPLGATLVVFTGLNIWQSLFVAVVGAAGSFAIVGVVSIAGRRGGAPSLTLSRATFGVRGNIGPTIVSLMSRLGWETVNTTTAAFVLLSLFTLIFGGSGEPKSHAIVTVVAIIVFITLTLVVSGMGHATILMVQKWSTWIFGALNIFVAVFLIATVNWDAVTSTPAGSTSAVLIGIGTIAAGTGIGWANAGADMSRYQKTSVKAGSLIMSSAAGAGIPLVLLIGLGALLSSGNQSLAQASDPVAAIREILPAWMAIPYLITAFGGLLLSNHLSVYSASLSTLTLGFRIKRVYAVGVDVAVTFVGALYFMLVSDGFYGPFITFISVLAVPISAWLGVFITDMIKRRTYDADGLMNITRTSRYWYTGGINWFAFGSWAIAIVVGFLFTAIELNGDVIYDGPLSDSWIGHNGLGWVATFTVAAVLHLVSGGARQTDSAAHTGVVTQAVAPHS